MVLRPRRGFPPGKDSKVFLPTIRVLPIVFSLKYLRSLERSTFVDIIAADANDHNVDHRISVVKFAKPDYYGSEESVVEGNHFLNFDYNYTEVLLNRRNARNEAAFIKNQVNSLVA